MKQITFALMVAGVLGMTSGCTRQGSQDQQQEPQSQESAVPSEQDSMNRPMGSGESQNQETVVPREQSQPGTSPAQPGQ